MATPPQDSPPHEAVLEGEDAPSSQVLPSSPPALPSSGGRPRKPPSVTPNTFRRFFTPRRTVRPPQRLLFARWPLGDITARPPTTNRSRKGRNYSEYASQPATDAADSVSGDEAPLSTQGPGKRRKTSHHPDPNPHTPPQSEDQLGDPVALVEDGDNGPTLDRPGSPEIETEEDSEDPSDLEWDNEDSDDDDAPAPFVHGLNQSAAGTRLFHRSLGMTRSNRPPPCDRASWDETALFHSGTEDVHTYESNPDTEPPLPFCVTSCNTSSLVAIGDEEGGIRIFDSDRVKSKGFSTMQVRYLAHPNAILDLSFSSDDKLLATASGDQTTLVIDVVKQQTVCGLSAHITSVKQVRFQPGTGSSNIIATSSRDGSVRIWDLRCKTHAAGEQQPVIHLDGPGSNLEGRQPVAPTTYLVEPINSIVDAHADRGGIGASHGAGRASGVDRGAADPPKENVHARKGDVSVTSLAFLPEGRENLFVTASEANACIKLWDLRAIRHPRRGKAIPLSTTQQLESHERYREFGVTSLALSTDSGRLYSLCRDNVVYAYSTNHLILGHAPELSMDWVASSRRAATSSGRKGLGPLYGFRHPSFFATSFYVKLDLRPATTDYSELLAVGSSGGNPVLIPTDESLLGSALSRQSRSPAAPSDITSVQLSQALAASSVPIVHNYGTALINGHDREVSNVTWTIQGNLATISDDLTARCWYRESPPPGSKSFSAKQLREMGENEGQTWGCGWADVDEGDEDV